MDEIKALEKGLEFFASIKQTSPPHIVDSGASVMPVKELHLSLQKIKQTGELLAVTYTDDEHRIVEVLWQRPPVKELTDEEINWLAKAYSTMEGELNAPAFARAILRKAQEK